MIQTSERRATSSFSAREQPTRCATLELARGGSAPLRTPGLWSLEAGVVGGTEPVGPYPSSIRALT